MADPTIFTVRYADPNEVVTFTVEYDAGIDADRARAAHAGMCGVLQGCEERTDRVAIAVEAALGSFDSNGYLGRLVRCEPFEVGLAVTDPG